MISVTNQPEPGASETNFEGMTPVNLPESKNFGVEGPTSNLDTTSGPEMDRILALINQFKTDPDRSIRALVEIGAAAEPALSELRMSLDQQPYTDQRPCQDKLIAEALSRIRIQTLATLSPDETSIPTCIEALRNWDPKVAAAAAEGFVKIGAASVPVLIRELDPIVEGLKKYNEVDRSNFFISDSVLRAPLPNNAMAVRALGEIEPKSKTTLGLLTNMLGWLSIPECHNAYSYVNRSKTYRGDLRDEVVVALGNFGPAAKESAATLGKLICSYWNSKSNHGYVYDYSALSALSKIGPSAHKAVPDLTDALKNALGPTSYNKSQPPAYKDDGQEAARAIIDTLSNIGPAAWRAVPTLINAIGMGSNAPLAIDKATRRAALRAVGRILNPLLAARIFVNGLVSGIGKTAE